MSHNCRLHLLVHAQAGPRCSSQHLLTIVPCGVGLVRPLGRRLTLAPRAVLPGSEHIADLAAHVSRWAVALWHKSSSSSCSSTRHPRHAEEPSAGTPACRGFACAEGTSTTCTSWPSQSMHCHGMQKHWLSGSQLPGGRLTAMRHLVCCCSLAHSTQQLYTVAVDDVVAQAAAAATTVAADDSQSGGTFGFLADGFEAFLKVGSHPGMTLDYVTRLTSYTFHIRAQVSDIGCWAGVQGRQRGLLGFRDAGV